MREVATQAVIALMPSGGRMDHLVCTVTIHADDFLKAAQLLSPDQHRAFEETMSTQGTMHDRLKVLSILLEQLGI